MKVTQAIKSYKEYHSINSKKNTVKNYEFIFTQFQDGFSDRKIDSITPDEIIFKTTNPRNRIMLELMARGGMRVGEVLKIRPIDVQDRKIKLPEKKAVRNLRWYLSPIKRINENFSGCMVMVNY